jgi:hypothetical protein
LEDTLLSQFDARQHAFYTTSAAVQFKLSRETVSKNGGSRSQWRLLVEAASGSDRKYDWEKKVSVCFSPQDISVFLLGFREAFAGNDAKTEKPRRYAIFHDPGKNKDTEGQVQKTIGIKKGEKYGHFLVFYQKMATPEGPREQTISIPLSDSQMIELELLLQAAFPLLIGYYNEPAVIVPSAVPAATKD